MKKSTRKTPLIAIILGMVLIGLFGIVRANHFGTVSAADFKEHYSRVGKPETMRATEFRGIEDGLAVIEVRRMSFLNPKKWKTRRVAVKLEDLDPAFREEVAKASPAGADGSR